MGNMMADNVSNSFSAQPKPVYEEQRMYAVASMPAESAQNASAGQSMRMEAGNNKTLKCLKCGTDNVSHAKFCMYCGEKIETPKKLFCPECGTPLPLEAKFCMNCGARSEG